MASRNPRERVRLPIQGIRFSIDGIESTWKCCGRRFRNVAARPPGRRVRPSGIRVWVANQVCDSYKRSSIPLHSRFPMLPILRNPMRKLQKLGRGVCPQAGYGSVKPQDKWTHGNRKSPQQPRPAERPDEGNKRERHHWHKENQENCEPVTFRRLEDTNTLTPLHGVLQNGARLFSREMMEASKERPKSLQVRGNPSRIHRIGVKGESRMRRARGMFECS